MPATRKKKIQDQLTQLMLQAAIILAYQKGVYPDSKDIGADKSRAQIAEVRFALLKNLFIEDFDEALQSEVQTTLDALLDTIKILNKDELENCINMLNHAMATGTPPEAVLKAFTDSQLAERKEPIFPEVETISEPVPESTDKPKPKAKHLVLSGGGIKGVANETVFETLQDNGVLEGIDHCYGSSVGGLSAALLALGYNIEEAKENMQVTKKMLLDPYRHEEVSPLATAKYAVKNLFKHAAIAKGYKLYELSQNVVAQKLGNPNATFADLAAKIGEPLEGGGKYRHLTVTATVKDPRRGFYQVVLNAQTVPKMPIALALRMTAGLPPAFRGIDLTPEELEKFREGATKPMVQYKRGEGFPPYNPDDPKDEIPITAKKQNVIRFIDGGVTDNLPIYLPAQSGAKMDEIIALNFAEPWRLEHREKKKDKFATAMFIKSMDERAYIDTNKLREKDFLYYVYQRKRYKAAPAIPPEYLMRAMQAHSVIDIPTGDVKAAEFDLSEERKQILREAGKAAAEKYLRQHKIEVKVVEPKSEQAKLEKRHETHKDVLERSKEFLAKQFGLHDNAAYLDFKRKVDETEKGVDYLSYVVSKNVKETKAKFNEIYKMRNEVSDAFDQAKKDCNFAQQCLYNVWAKVPIMKKIVKKVDKKLDERFNVFSDFKAVAKALNGALKAQRDAALEKGHKKYSPYKAHLSKAQLKSMTTSIAKSLTMKPKGK